MSTGLRWTSEQYQQAQAKAKFAPAILPEAFRKPAQPIVLRETVTITLPWPPTVNHMHINVIKGRIRSKGYIAFCELVAHIVEREKIASMGSKRLAVTITLNWPNKRRGDLDNRAKAVLDSLQRAGVYTDDEQIDRLTLVRGEIIKGGLSVVTIEAM